MNEQGTHTQDGLPTAGELAASRANLPVRMGSLKEMEGDEPDLSATTTVEERFAMMWQLAKDAWAMRGEPVGEPHFRDILSALSG